MAILSEKLTRDIAQAFHLGLRRDAVSAQEAKELAVFLFGLAHLAEGRAGAPSGSAAMPTEANAAAAANPFLSTDEAMLATMRSFLNQTNQERGYDIKSPLLEHPGPQA